MENKMKKMPVKKKWAWKKWKMGQKVGVKMFFARENLEKMAQHGFHRHFYFHGKKKHSPPHVILRLLLKGFRYQNISYEIPPPTFFGIYLRFPSKSRYAHSVFGNDFPLSSKLCNTHGVFLGYLYAFDGGEGGGRGSRGGSDADVPSLMSQRSSDIRGGV